MSLLTLLPSDSPYAIWDLLLVTGQVSQGHPQHYSVPGSYTVLVLVPRN